MKKMRKNLKFDVAMSPANRKTRVWLVLSTHGDRPCLGQVRWYGTWRQYVFFPQDSTIFSASCLEELAEFCKSKTKEHRVAKGK